LPHLFPLVCDHSAERLWALANRIEILFAVDGALEALNEWLLVELTTTFLFRLIEKWLSSGMGRTR
jgi:hypothetical protein